MSQNKKLKRNATFAIAEIALMNSALPTSAYNRQILSPLQHTFGMLRKYGDIPTVCIEINCENNATHQLHRFFVLRVKNTIHRKRTEIVPVELIPPPSKLFVCFGGKKSFGVIFYASSRLFYDLGNFYMSRFSSVT